MLIKAGVDMTRAGSEKHRQLIGIRNKAIEEGQWPEELYNKVTLALYGLYQWGVPLSEAIKIGKIIVENYWRDKNADKNGG